MQTVTVTTPDKTYQIAIASGLLASSKARDLLTPLVKGRKCLLVSDSNVAPLYADCTAQLVESCGAEAVGRVVFPAGEESKNLGTVAELYHQAISAGLNRRSIVLALGGGVVGDMAGFAAATYMRGIPFVQIPTSLLAMVDSSVGGKVGCDLPEGKNLVGAFHQPELVLADLAALDSLPVREQACGWGEVIKYAVIMDADFFELLGEHADLLLKLDPARCEEVVARCCRLKAEVVAQDEREQGLRAILNYGHTFGHALETIGGFSALNHGEGVAIGMGIAADLAVKLGMAPASLAARQDELLRRFGLPTTWSLEASDEAVLKLMYRDKKVLQNRLRLVLPTAIGSVSVVECDREDLVKEAIGGRRARP